ANGPSKPRFEGQQVIFPPVDSLPPGQKFTYTVGAQAMKIGDARLKAELRSATLQGPVVEYESTTIYGFGSDRNRPPAASPPAGSTGRITPVPSGIVPASATVPPPTPSSSSPLGPPQ